MRIERRLKPRTAIDMTPLIDVIMQLIIFFMITTTFRTAPGIALQLPGSSTARPVPQGELRVLALSDREIYVDGQATDLAGLEQAVAKAALERRRGAAATPAAAATGGGDGSAGPGLRALVEGEAGADYQLIVTVLDALRSNGIGSVGLATRTGQGGTR